MKTPVILAAFGNASASTASTYRFIEEKVRPLLAETPLFLAFSARTGQKSVQESFPNTSLSPTERLATLAAQGISQAVIQPLQLLPGQEFHMLQRECRESPIPLHFGRPLLATPQDYRDFAESLAPMIEGRPDQAILLIGHGTSHPIWIAYHAIERYLRQRFGNRLFVGVIEKNPDSSMLPGEIIAAGWKRVYLIPLLLTTGMHFERDVNGHGPLSWRSRLESLGINVDSVDQGLGHLPGVIALLTAHIREALAEAADTGPSTPQR